MAKKKKKPSLKDYPEPALNDMIGGVAKALRAITDGVPVEQVHAWVENRDRAQKASRAAH